MGENPAISIVMASFNRREVVLATLQRLYSLGPEIRQCEIIVVDNSSSDGSAEAVAKRFPQVRLVALDGNWGSCAKAFGVDVARGEYVVFLDDDSYPRPGTLTSIVDRLNGDKRLGAASCTVHLPDGRNECSALPDVFIGCGVGFRREVLQEVGGLDRTLFMQAEEYDLSFRLINAGYKVATFDDLHVDHLKSPHARIGERTVYHDTRNNMLLVSRYLGGAFAEVYTADWDLRYRWIAESSDYVDSFDKAMADSRTRSAEEASDYADKKLGDAAFEQIFRVEEIAGRMAVLHRDGCRRVILADFGKNIYPFVRAADRLGIEVVCIADDRFFREGRVYRGIELMPVASAITVDVDAVIVSNTSPVHAAITHARLEELTDKPVFAWFCQQNGCVCGSSVVAT